MDSNRPPYDPSSNTSFSHAHSNDMEIDDPSTGEEVDAATTSDFAARWAQALDTAFETSQRAIRQAVASGAIRLPVESPPEASASQPEATGLLPPFDPEKDAVDTEAAMLEIQRELNGYCDEALRLLPSVIEQAAVRRIQSAMRPDSYFFARIKAAIVSAYMYACFTRSRAVGYKEWAIRLYEYAGPTARDEALRLGKTDDVDREVGYLVVEPTVETPLAGLSTAALAAEAMGTSEQGQGAASELRQRVSKRARRGSGRRAE